MGEARSSLKSPARAASNQGVAGGGAAIFRVSTGGEHQVSVSRGQLSASATPRVWSGNADMQSRDPACFGIVDELLFQPETSGRTLSSVCGGVDTNNTDTEKQLHVHLIALLRARQPQQSLLLSDLGALLPSNFRTFVKDNGGLRSSLRKYPKQFRVTGHPGKENVALIVMDSSQEECEMPSTYVEKPAAMMGAEQLDQHRHKKKKFENESTVQFRGLPYRATVNDIKTFLGDHIHDLTNDDDDAVQLVLNRNGRPSGFALVQLKSPDAARKVCDELHKKVMRLPGIGSAGTAQFDSGNLERYVEAFLFHERPNMIRLRKAAISDVDMMQEGGCSNQRKITNEDVIQEIRDHLKSYGKGEILLSLLGVALSQDGRLFLKNLDQGLKHFLQLFPSEFQVAGAKGREIVILLSTAHLQSDNGGAKEPKPHCSFPTPDYLPTPDPYNELTWPCDFPWGNLP